MAAPQPSPSEFLTFYRYASRTTANTLRRSVPSSRSPSTSHFFQPSYTRPLHVSSRLQKDSSVKTDQYGPGKREHGTKKASEGDHYDVQTSNIKAGWDAKAKGSGGHATEEKDSAGAMKKAKKEFPEAPDVAIGMQDERGGRGG